MGYKPVTACSLFACAANTQVPVKQGPGAMEEFQLKIRELFNIGPDAEIDVSFVCKVPCGSGE